VLVHFGLPTYAVNDAEYNVVFPFNSGGVPDMNRFNPEKLDAGQWVLMLDCYPLRLSQQ
jgi:hypothetical protein